VGTLYTALSLLGPWSLAPIVWFACL